MLRYMRKLERGEPKPKRMSNGTSTVAAKSTLFIDNTKGIWKPNDFMPNLLTVTKPLMDRTNTPRGALRAISCERNFTHAKWLYNKRTMDNFNPEYSKKDIQRSKNLMKIQKKEDKKRESSSKKRSQMDTMTSGFKTNSSIPRNLNKL